MKKVSPLLDGSGRISELGHPEPRNLRKSFSDNILRQRSGTVTKFTSSFLNPALRYHLRFAKDCLLQSLVLRYFKDLLIDFVSDFRLINFPSLLQQGREQSA
jgi:hypothetical protein